MDSQRVKANARKERQRLRDLALNEVIGSLSKENKQSMVNDFFKQAYRQ